MNFCRGNAIKYLWRAGDKNNELEDLKKARWYLDREISRIEKTMKRPLAKRHSKIGRYGKSKLRKLADSLKVPFVPKGIAAASHAKAQAVIAKTEHVAKNRRNEP